MSRYLDKANFHYQDVFDACISTYTERNKDGIDKKNRLRSYYDLNVRIISEYENLLLSDKIHELKDDPPNPETTEYKDDMIGMYKNKLSKKGEPARGYYDQILKLAKLYTCPFCSHREATTLDHVYPKTIYPSLAIAPINLVPSCSECNNKKGTADPSTLENSLFHPYYDDINQEVWLEVKFDEIKKFTIDYKIVKPITWPNSKFRRLKNEIKLLDLCDFYSRQGMVSFSTSYSNFKGVFTRHGREELEIILTELLESNEENFGLNSWQAALYRSFIKSEWFCNGGFILDDDLV